MPHSKARCQHCGHAPHPTTTRSVVVDEPGRPVAAPCCLTGCHYAELEELRAWKELALLSLKQWHDLGDVLRRRYPLELGDIIPVALRAAIEADTDGR